MNDELCNEVSPSTSPGIRDPASVGLIKPLKLSRIGVVDANIFLALPITSIDPVEINRAATLRSLLLITRTSDRIA